MRALLVSAALIFGIALSAGSTAFAQIRGQYGSDWNVFGVRRVIDGQLFNLAHDQIDYGGHKAAAMADLQAARAQLIAAERWAHAHGH